MIGKPDYPKSVTMVPPIERMFGQKQSASSWIIYLFPPILLAIEGQIVFLAYIPDRTCRKCWLVHCGQRPSQQDVVAWHDRAIYGSRSWA
jgi:hypothetical protein